MADEAIIRRTAVPPPVRIRRNVAQLPAGDRTLFFYGEAIREMRARSARNPLDPTGWTYQANVHDASPGVLPPGVSNFWGQCQHNCWYFLPWHRMYLHFFEKTIMQIVASMAGGPKDWALPYWNYSTSAAAARLPQPFRVPASESANPLYIPQRGSTANAGGDFLNIDRFGNPLPGQPHTNLNCLNQTSYQDHFGGGARVNHPGGTDNAGALELVPHNTVHSTVGSFMGGFATAPLDPIFWLHHCNIDRLWEVWVQRQKQKEQLSRNPKPGQSSAWDSTSFDFHDENGNPVSVSSARVLNTRIPPLSYEYDDISDPLP